MRINIFLLITAISFLIGCNRLDNRDMDEDGDCIVSFDLVGEITTSERPMTKVSTDDLYLVQINADGACFASGIYDDVDNIRINLKKGASYSFIISMIRNGRTILGDRVSTTNNSVQISYYGFVNSRGYWGDVKNDSFGWLCYQNDSHWWPINNCYYKSIGFQYYENSSTTVLSDGSFEFLGHHCYFGNIGLACLSGVQYPQCDDWFYGEINNYTPSGNYETLPLELKRVGFKLKYELSGVTDGEVNVQVYKEKSDENGDSQIIRTFINNTTSTATYASDPSFYAFYDAQSAWQYADDYMENFTLAVSWHRGIGITEDYGTKTIQIKRNCLNNIKINLGSNDQSAGMNLTVESESTIGAESVTIPVE